MSSLVITRGLAGFNSDLILQGFLSTVSTIPGFYRGVQEHPIFKILQRGLEVRQLYWRSEELSPMIVLVDTRKDKQSVPVRVAILNSENIMARTPIAMLATEYIDSIIRIAYPKTEFVESKIPVAISQEESILGCLNIYDEFEWAKIRPTAVFSLNKSFEVKPFEELKITKSKELELVRK